MPSVVEDGADGCYDCCGHLGSCPGGYGVDNTGAKDMEIGKDEPGMGILADEQRRSGAGFIAIGAAREYGGEYLTRRVHPSLNNTEKLSRIRLYCQILSQS